MLTAIAEQHLVENQLADAARPGGLGAPQAAAATAALRGVESPLKASPLPEHGLQAGSRPSVALSRGVRSTPQSIPPMAAKISPPTTRGTPPVRVTGVTPLFPKLEEFPSYGLATTMNPVLTPGPVDAPGRTPTASPISSSTGAPLPTDAHVCTKVCDMDHSRNLSHMAATEKDLTSGMVSTEGEGSGPQATHPTLWKSHTSPSTNLVPEAVDTRGCGSYVEPPHSTAGTSPTPECGVNNPSPELPSFKSHSAINPQNVSHPDTLVVITHNGDSQKSNEMLPKFTAPVTDRGETKSQTIRNEQSTIHSFTPGGTATDGYTPLPANNYQNVYTPDGMRPRQVDGRSGHHTMGDDYHPAESPSPEQHSWTTTSVHLKDTVLKMVVELGRQAMEWGRDHPRVVCISMAYVGRAWLLYACLLLHSAMKATLAAIFAHVQRVVPTLLMSWELNHQLVYVLVSPINRLIASVGCSCTELGAALLITWAATLVWSRCRPNPLPGITHSMKTILEYYRDHTKNHNGMTTPPNNPDRNSPRERCNASPPGEVGPILGMLGAVARPAGGEPLEDEGAELVLEDNEDGELAEPTAFTSTGLSCENQGTRTCLGATCEAHTGELPAVPDNAGGAEGSSFTLPRPADNAGGLVELPPGAADAPFCVSPNSRPLVRDEDNPPSSEAGGCTADGNGCGRQDVGPHCIPC